MSSSCTVVAQRHCFFSSRSSFFPLRERYNINDSQHSRVYDMLEEEHEGMVLDVN